MIVITNRAIIIITLLLIIISSCACTGNLVNTDESNNLEEISMIEYKPAEFNSVKSFFSGFDENHIVNFHYTDLTDRSWGAVPGPTTIQIEGYFEIVEEQWDSYTSNSEYTWREVANSNLPHISGFSDTGGGIQWLRSSEWTNAHRGDKVGGALYISNETRLVWFSVGR